MEQLRFEEQYSDLFRKNRGRAPTEAELTQAWEREERRRELELEERRRELEREERRREEQQRLDAREAASKISEAKSSLTEDQRQRLIAAVLADPNVASVVLGVGASPELWPGLLRAAPPPQATPELPPFRVFAQRLAPATPVPDIFDLELFLASELLERIPVDGSVGPDTADVLVQRQGGGYRELGIVAYAILYQHPSHGVGENTMICAIDCLVTAVIQALASGCMVNITIGRNVTDFTSATVRHLKPDLLAWLDMKLLVFKGEEKFDQRELNVAVMELASKLPEYWDPELHGRLPYLLGYAAAGGTLRFYAVPVTASDRTPFPISPAYNLAIPGHRAHIVRSVVNLFRIFRSMSRFAPPSAVPPLYSEVSAPGTNSRVVVMNGYVIKRTTVYTEFNVLQVLYDALEEANMPGSACPTPFLVLPANAHERDTGGGKQLSVELRPVAATGLLPASEAELQDCVRQVLRALAWLHARGWVHRDLRWPNVLRAPHVGWLLADLESAVPSGTGTSLNTEPPEISEPSQLWTPAADVFMVGKLMETCGVNLSVRGRALRSRLLSGQLERPTASAALLDPWLEPP